MAERHGRAGRRVAAGLAVGTLTLAVVAVVLSASGSRSPSGPAPASTRAVPVRSSVRAPPPPRRRGSRRDAPIEVSPHAIRHGPRTRRRIALTFDADMTEDMRGQLRSGTVASWYDRALVRELRRTHTPATVFMTGLWAGTYPGPARSLTRDPRFEIENHSVDHRAWTQPCFGLPGVGSAAEKRAEVAAAARSIRRIARVRPRYFRFPGGCQTKADLRLVAAGGEQPVDWDVVSGDAFQPDPQVIVQNVLREVRPGSIVVMHLIGGPNAPATARAVRALIPGLLRRGYRFVTLRTLLAPGAR